MSKKVYIAGPMQKIPQFNFPAFFAADLELTSRGYETFNPAQKDIEKYGEAFYNCPNGTHEEAAAVLGFELNNRDFARTDLNWIIDNADAICPLLGWQNSKGARTEMALAEWLGLEVIYLWVS